MGRTFSLVLRLTLLQFSIEYPSTWDIDQDEDIISFKIDPYNDLDVVVEPLLTLDPSEYAREKLNEQRKYDLEIIGLNETTINGQPAYRSQYHESGDTMGLSYFIVTEDYKGYRLKYEVDDFLHQN